MNIEKPKIGIHNVETDELEYRDMTNEEFAQFQLDRENALERKAEIEAKAAARQAILDRLGLTEEEAKLLLS